MPRGSAGSAGEDLVQHAAERVHVGRQVDALAARLLGRHVAGRAEQIAGSGVADVVARKPARRRRSDSASSAIRASPQSRTYASPKSPSMMFAGLRSRWITPRVCANSIARQTSTSRASSCGAASGSRSPDPSRRARRRAWCRSAASSRRTGCPPDRSRGRGPARPRDARARPGRAPRGRTGRASASSRWVERSSLTATSRSIRRVARDPDLAHPAAAEHLADLVAVAEIRAGIRADDRLTAA